MNQTLTAIAAVARNRVIGRDNAMIWHLPEDFRRFKKTTMGGVLVLGRRTFDSIGKPLPGRQTIVLTRDPAYVDERVVVVHGVDEALTALGAFPDRRCWIAGGGEVYRLFWDHLTHLDITEVHDEPQGDALFPLVEAAHWQETSRTPGDVFDFVEYARVPLSGLDQASLPWRNPDANLRRRCQYGQETRDEDWSWLEPGIEGAVMLCLVHGYPAGGMAYSGVKDDPCHWWEKSYDTYRKLFPATTTTES